MKISEKSQASNTNGCPLHTDNGRLGRSKDRQIETHADMTNKWLEVQGLVSVRELWVKFHYV